MKVLVAVARWFDNSIGVKPISENEALDIDYVRSIPFLLLHLMCFAVIWVGWSWTAVIIAISLYFVRMFAITGFYHRYFSHRSFETSRWAQFLFAAWGNSAVQKGPLWWAAHHRHHHRHSDKETDLHSPHTSGFFWSHIGWITCKGNFKTNLKAVPDLASYPELRFLDRFETVVPILLASTLFGLGSLLERVAPQLGTSGPQLLVWGFFISTIVLFHGTCTINSLSHLFGNKRYQTSDESRNNFILALVTLGEGWHNNHHHFPAAVRQGFYWWEIDITYYVLCFFSRLGLIWNLTPVPEAARNINRV
ncbi:MAG: acyl-CoA desaturase [Acidobacteriota bacterium]